MKDNSPQSTAVILKKISSIKFGGKDNGRFKISYERMQQISGLTILTQSFLEDLEYYCSSELMTIINLGNEFAILDTRVVKGYRNVPQGIIEKVVKRY